MPAKTNKQKKAAIYARVSSTSQKDGAGISRQNARCKATCKSIGAKVALEVSEVVSGSLPLKQRKIFNELMEKCKDKGVSNIVVEGTRAFSRNAKVSETIYERSKELGLNIIPVDVPDLLEHNPNPAQKFLRRVMFSYTELEKDMAVQRLQHGWNRKLTEAKKNHRTGQCKARLNQSGKVQINGRKSIVETKSLSGKQRRQLLEHTKLYFNGDVTVRELAKHFSKAMKLTKAGPNVLFSAPRHGKIANPCQVMAAETARRTAHSLQKK